jgi:hypothetical protein
VKCIIARSLEDLPILKLHKLKDRKSIYEWSTNHRLKCTEINDKHKDRRFFEVQESTNMIPASSRFFHMWQICAASDDRGFQSRLLRPAQEFIEKAPLTDIASGEDLDNSISQPQILQSALLSAFYRKDVDVDFTRAAQAGLCLRCYVSEPILKACQKIDSLFNGQECFTYRDLLPFVLNDDGKTLIVLETDDKKQLALDPAGKAQTATYSTFSVKILQTFSPNLKSSMSLDNWTHLQTRQSPEIKKFLSEFGFQQVSDWALLNRVRTSQLECLSDRDQHLITVFHSVYRRDRHQQPRHSTKCPNPSSGQLQEMLSRLQTQGISCSGADQLLTDLKQVASQLRQYDIWCSREPLDVYDPTTEAYSVRADLPHETSHSTDVEQQEFLAFLNQQLIAALTEAIEQCIRDRIATLAGSKRYSLTYISGLLLYYRQGLPLREIASQLGMTSWDQARRILNPGELLSQVRTLTVGQFLKQTLAKAQKMGFTQQPTDPGYLSSLIEQIEAFVDTKIFQNAAEELRAGKNRLLNSVYAQHLSLTLEKYQKSTTAVKEYNHA